MDIRKRVELFRLDSGEDDGDIFPDNSVLELLADAGEHIIEIDSYAIERRKSILAVESKGEYSLPDDFYDGRRMLYDNDDMLSKTDLNGIRQIDIGYYGLSQPFVWAVYNDLLHLRSKPGSGGKTTTLVGAHTATSTSITVVTPSAGDLPNRGAIKINSEVIYYEKKETSGANSALSILTRGAEDTVAAAHSDGDTVTHYGIEFYYYARYRRFLKAPETGEVNTASGGSNLTVGTHYLMWTYYDSAKGLESYPFNMGSVKSSSGEKLSLTGFNDAPDLESYKKRVYKTKAGLTQPFYLATTINAGTLTGEIDITDATLAANSAFSWASVGGDNLPDKLHLAQVDYAVAKRFKQRKRFTDASFKMQEFAEHFGFGVSAIRRVRRVSRGRNSSDLHF
ncbi:MAG: hypothetical protein ACE5D6_04900 [Candidatus Zixiibacteriota bacterium]